MILRGVPRIHLLCFCALCFLLVVPACSSSDVGATTSDAALTCSYGGRTYGVGETFYDDCRPCTCLLDGNATRVVCPFLLCIDTGFAVTSGGSSGAGGVSGSGGAVGGAAGGRTGTSGVSRWPDGSAGLDAASCDQLAAAARAQYQSSLGSTASLACRLDSDCTFFFLPLAQYCFATCGDAVAKADVSALEAATASICDRYWAAGCPTVPVPPCIPKMSVCDRGHCAEGWPSSPDSGAGGTSGSGGADGDVSGKGGASGSDGGASLDSGVSSKCSACGSDELCVGYYDGMCTPMSTRCIKVSAATRESILVKHERCFMRAIGDEICGNWDGGIFWGCGEPPCPSEPLVSDINCYGP